MALKSWSYPKGTTFEEMDEAVIKQIRDRIKPGVLVSTVRFFVFADTDESAFEVIRYGLYNSDGTPGPIYSLERLEILPDRDLGKWRLVFLQDSSAETFDQQIRDGRKHFNKVAEISSADSESPERRACVYDGPEADTLVPVLVN